MVRLELDTIDEILEAIKEKQEDSETLRQRMESDFDLLTLSPYVPTQKGYESYTSSAPRNFFDKVSDGLNRSQMTIQIKLAEDATETQRRAASLGELYLFGALNAIDRRLMKRGEPPLREIMGFYVNCRGWYGLRVLVYVPLGEKDTVFDVVPWDVMHSVFEQGPQGLLWCANQHQDTKAQIEAAYGITIPNKTAIVTDFWDCDRNGIIIGTDQWGKDINEDTSLHKIGHVPVLIGRVGPMPTIIRKDNAETTGDNTLDLQGDSVWTSSRNLYEPQNKYISWVMDMAKRAVAGSLIHESKDGTKTLAGDPYLTFQEIKLSTDAGERLYPLESPQLSPETPAILSIIDGDMQRSTLPDPLSFGGVKDPMSGRALSILNDNTRSKYSPGTGAMAQIYTWLCEELLQQFAQKGMKTAELRGFDPKEEFFTVKVKPKDINKAWYVQVQVEPRLPRDRDQELNQAQRATAKPSPDQDPLMSMGTAREDILHMRDPDSERDKILVEVGESLEPIRVAQVAAALVKAGKEDLAQQITDLLGPGGPGGGEGGVGAPPNGVPLEPAPPDGPLGGIPPGPGGPQLPLPPEVLEAVFQALIAMGQPQLAEALAAALEGGGPVPPEVIEAIVQALISAGQEPLAEALLAALGGPPAAGPAGPIQGV